MLFLHIADEPFPVFQRALTLPARLQGVPDEAALRTVWRATCASYGGEIYTDDPTWMVRVPPGLSSDGMAMVFRPPREGRAQESPIEFESGHARDAQPSAQFSTFNPVTRLNSRALFVTSVRPSARA